MNVDIDKEWLGIMSLINRNFSKTYEPAIKLFCEYIASNENFKYNPTYLTDQIENFERLIKEITIRKSYYKKMWGGDELNKIIERWPLNNWMLVWDDLFVLLSNYKNQVFTIEQIKRDQNINILDDFVRLIKERFKLSLYDFNCTQRKKVLFVKLEDRIIEHCKIIRIASRG